MARLLDPEGRARVSLRGPTVTTTVTNLTIVGASALAGVVSARLLGPAGRGQLAIAMLWSAAIHVVGSLGLQSSCSYHMACWPGRRAALATWFGRVAARQAIVMTAVSAATMWWLHTRLGLAPPLAIEYTTWPAAGTITLYGATYAQGSGDFARFNTVRLISGVMPAALMLTSIMAVRLTPAEAGAAYLVPTWCGAVLAIIWLRRASHGAPDEPLSSHELRSVWSYGWRSLASISGLMLNNSADQFTLGLLVPVASLGLYSVGAAASSPLLPLVASLGMVGLPTVAPLAYEAKVTATWQILRRAARRVALLAPPLAVLLPWAIPRLYGVRYAAAVVPAELLLLGTACAALTTVADDLLRAHGLPGFVSVTQGAGGALTIIGALLLDGRPLAAVALVSSLGFVVTFVLAVARLWVATRRLRLGAQAVTPHRGSRNT
jgi:antigen flippase